MIKEIFMPKLSSTMEVGTILEWLKEVGDTVEVGEPLFEIMTDKINIEVESYEEGVLLKKYYQEDDEVPVNTIVGYVGQPDDEVPDEPPANTQDEAVSGDESVEAESEGGSIKDSFREGISEAGKLRATPAARRIAKENDFALSAVSGSGPKGRIHEKDVELAIKDNNVLITPLAEKIAKEHYLDLSQIIGSGVRGEIKKEDVENYLAAQESHGDTSVPTERVKLKGLRKAVADKMLDSVRSIPHVTLTTDIDMTQVIKMRKELLPTVEKQTGFRLSYTEIIMKATAHTLTRHRNMNTSLVDNEIVYNNNVNIGLAVAVENGLIVPSVQDVDKKGLAELTEVSKSLGKKARDNKLTSLEMTGST